MIEKFIQDKKILLQIIGVLIAIRGIFLAIQPSDNPSANVALMQIQISWVHMISLSLLCLWVLIIDFLRKVDFNISNYVVITIMALIAFVIPLWLIVNLYSYIFEIYIKDYDFYRIYDSTVMQFSIILNIGLYLSTVLMFFNQHVNRRKSYKKYHIAMATIYSIVLGLLGTLTTSVFLIYRYKVSWFTHLLELQVSIFFCILYSQFVFNLALSRRYYIMNDLSCLTHMVELEY
jgi:hypothetical protein